MYIYIYTDRDRDRERERERETERHRDRDRQSQRERADLRRHEALGPADGRIHPTVRILPTKSKNCRLVVRARHPQLTAKIVGPGASLL